MKTACLSDNGMVDLDAGVEKTEMGMVETVVLQN